MTVNSRSFSFKLGQIFQIFSLTLLPILTNKYKSLRWEGSGGLWTNLHLVKWDATISSEDKRNFLKIMFIYKATGKTLKTILSEYQARSWRCWLRRMPNKPELWQVQRHWCGQSRKLDYYHDDSQIYKVPNNSRIWTGSHDTLETDIIFYLHMMNKCLPKL